MRTVAVTFEHDKSTYSQLWWDYYSLAVDDVHIVHLGRELNSDWGATHRMMNELQGPLFEKFDRILFADIDEFLVPVNGSLREFLCDNEDKVVRGTGYNVVEVDGDSPLNIDSGILRQRQWWSRDSQYDKYVLITEPVEFVSNHAISVSQSNNEGLLLVHLRDADLASARQRAKIHGREFNEAHFADRLRGKEEIPDNLRDRL